MLLKNTSIYFSRISVYLEPLLRRGLVFLKFGIRMAKTKLQCIQYKFEKCHIKSNFSINTYLICLQLVFIGARSTFISTYVFIMSHNLFMILPYLP